MSTPESKVRDPVVKWAEANGFMHFRMSFRIGVRQGTPDDLFIAPGGFHVWWEFKRPGKRPTPLQFRRISDLNEQGAMAGWSDNKETAMTVLYTILNTATLALAQGSKKL